LNVLGCNHPKQGRKFRRLKMPRNVEQESAGKGDSVSGRIRAWSRELKLQKARGFLAGKGALEPSLFEVE
jgi:hypothetical protein